MLSNVDSNKEKYHSLFFKLLNLVPIAGLIYSLGVTSLWIYFDRLGRLDVFHAALEGEKSFDIITTSLFISLFLFLLIFYTPSLLMVVCFNNKFYKKDGFPETIEYSIKAVFITSLLTLAIFLTGTYFFSLDPTRTEMLLSFIAIIVINLTSLYLSKRKEIKQNRISLMRKLKAYFLITPISITIISLAPITALALFIPLLKINNETSPLSFMSVVMISVVVIMFSQIPATIFLRDDKKTSSFKRACLAIGFALLLLIPISFVIKPIPIIIIDITMKLAGLTDYREHNYFIKSEDYSEKIFNNPVWQKEADKSENKYTIKGITFFAYKNVSLVCPLGIEKTYKEARKFSIFDLSFDTDILKELERKMQSCFVFDKNKIIQWNDTN
ncbi:hypothetical protein ACP3TC_06150 [Winslowiella sp. 2C04]|uniref:hypothetical protein n=1 Tax=Winslowiella sp. 2C04 TaxID=3416179 RepID=UPI003CF3E3AA